LLQLSHPRANVPIIFDGRYPGDESTLRQILDRVDSSVELTEPFARIREAMTEARKMGVTNRAA
jgi:hypothetical protein